MPTLAVHEPWAAALVLHVHRHCEVQLSYPLKAMRVPGRQAGDACAFDTQRSGETFAFAGR